MSYRVRENYGYQSQSRSDYKFESEATQTWKRLVAIAQADHRLCQEVKRLIHQAESLRITPEYLKNIHSGAKIKDLCHCLGLRINGNIYKVLARRINRIVRFRYTVNGSALYEKYAQ